MKSVLRGSLRWKTIMVLAPLALLVALAIATSGFLAASSAAYCGYAGSGVYCIDHVAPASQYGISDQLLYVANGQASDVKVIDVGTMSIVDTIPIPNQPTPAPLHDMNPGLMNWEVHGVVPAQDRHSIYAVGALSGGSYDSAGNFRLADYEMYQVDTATKAPIREIPLQSAGQPINPVGFCGLEYNLNDESSNEVIAASMNASNATLSTVLTDPSTGLPVDLGGVRGTGPGVEVGGWAFEDLASGTNTGFMSTNANATLESSTCGIAWNGDGTRGFASQMFEPLTDTVNWTTRTVDGEIAASSYSGNSYHQEASDKDRGRLYVTSSSGRVDVFDMSTHALIGSIDIRALTSSPYNDIHGVEIAPGHPDILYVTSRQTPTGNENMELVVDVSNLNAPTLAGAVKGLAKSACGVYADANKSVYYTAANRNSNNQDMLFVANGRASNVKVIDVATMSIVDTIPVPNQPTPGFIHDWNPGLMNWELHGVVASKDRGSVYAVGALSAGSYDSAGNFRLADYEMYQISTATKTEMREIPMQSAGQPINPVGFCGLEYNLNNENSNEVIGASMNAANATLATVLHDPVTGDPIDLGGVRGNGAGVEVGGWAFEDLTTGTNTGFMSTNANATLESSTCGIAWNAQGNRGFASQMFEPLTDTVNWTTRTVDGDIAASTYAGNSYHQEASDKARGLLYVTSSSGRIDVFDMNTNALVGSIDVRSLTGTLYNDIHGVELSPGNANTMYITSRVTPDANDNMELVVDVTDYNAPVLKGSIHGLATSVCGVYAIGNKSAYYGTGVKPALSLSKTRVYWASYADYSAGKLSVDYSIGNGAGADAASVRIVGSSSTAGVTIATALPHEVGGLAAGSSAPVTLQYNVPTGVVSFMTTTYATAQNGLNLYTYPGPYPGP